MSHQPLIIPQPKKQKFTGETVQIDTNTIKKVRSALLPLDPIEGVGFHTKPSMPDQAYHLKIDDNTIKIIAADELGKWYGIVTLRQLLDFPEPGMVPKCSIEDSPDYPIRGAHIDISRDRVPTIETLHTLIDLWSMLKYNQVQLYMEHTFAYSQHKKVWQDASPLTKEEVRELDAYCKACGIELVPNQNSFGHMERWFKHKEYHYLAETPNGFYDPWGRFRDVGSCIAPVEPKAIPFLEGLYDELLPQFTSRTINIGGDEPWELCRGRSKKECSQKGKGVVYLEFLLKIYNAVKERGYTMQFYGDIINLYPDLIPRLPEDVIVVNWGYEAEHPFEKECKEFEKSGKRFYICTGTSSWNSIGGRWSRAKGNILKGAEQGIKHGASGYILTEWGDNGHWQQLPIAYPAWIYGAGVSWALEQNRDMDIEEALTRLVFKTEDNNAAKALLTLESVPDKEPVYVRNGTVLAALLMDPVYPYYKETLQKCFHSDFSQVKEEINTAQTLIQRSSVPHDPQVKPEIDFTARLLDFACDVALAQLEKGYERLADIPVTEKKELLSRVDQLIDEYKSLWAKRSRPGGLSDSIARFEAFKDQLSLL